MPTSVTGALVLLLLAGPGFMYLLIAERSDESLRKLSAFRETVQVIIASGLSVAASLALFTPVRIMFPRVTPNVGALIDDPNAYFVQRYRLVWTWAVGLYALACILAFFAAHYGLSRKVDKVLTRRTGQSWRSAWDEVFSSTPAKGVRVLDCVLDDGTVIFGRLRSYNSEINETGDRDLVLICPVSVARPNGRVDRLEYGSLVLSARCFKWIHLQYMEESVFTETLSERCPQVVEDEVVPVSSG